MVGFSADWAGPEAADAIEKGTYNRWIPNMLQAPVRLADWSQFVRGVQREFKGRFDRWMFWENPDLEQAPQSLPAGALCRAAGSLPALGQALQPARPKSSPAASISTRRSATCRRFPRLTSCRSTRSRCR